ncbi:ornithine cyclodeaminase family protein [Allorhizobium sp. BGMRC 0089]|uniref:ornithine cyclodeaminase family protein n=1 Tax=Allorhizobium sonneratiae TaxID=2934936 RepID=UPI0020339F56|nr:ornithine cyclodeaminase family protein [Allorhizobium sonneratiae]MCM2294454.1 ornithine cyclodeaminase family protein [Allorhizobium sonneratiae]
MLILNAAATEAALPWHSLIDALDHMFQADCQMPVRSHHDMAVPGRANATLLIMPAWLPGRYCGVKLVSVFPDNHLSGLPAIQGGYILSSGETGEPLAMVDGPVLTARRTAAASALASRFLSRKEASHMLMVGTGQLSLNLIEAHASIRPLTDISIWGRSSAKAEEIAAKARERGLPVTAISNLAEAARQADIISCATLTEEPIIQGEWLKPGTHLDLVGGFKPSMREADDEAIRRSHIYVDTRAGAMKEAGDLVQPLEKGVLRPEEIKAELAELVSGIRAGRSSASDITLFKSVGAALEDLAGAILAYETVKATSDNTQSS